MTTFELGAALARRWYVVVLAVVLAVAGGYMLHQDGGVYTTQTVVSFFLPDKSSLSLNSGLDDASVIAFAGVVARDINADTENSSYSTDDAPLYGAGIRQGVLVSLPNAGSQFSTSYLRAELVVQIVGPTEQWVADKQAEILTKVIRASEAQQASVSSEKSRIKVAPVPLTKQIFHVLPTRTITIIAYAALVVAALLVGGWTAVVVDRTARRRKAAMRRHDLRDVVKGGSRI